MRVGALGRREFGSDDGIFCAGEGDAAGAALGDDDALLFVEGAAVGAGRPMASVNDGPATFAAGEAIRWPL